MQLGLLGAEPVWVEYILFSRTHASHIYELRNSICDIGCSVKD